VAALYVGGSFNVAGRVAASHLACSDPATATWSPVGRNPTYDDDIRALAVLGERWLVIGGDFHRFFSGGLPVAEGLWGMAPFDTARPLGEDPLSGYLHIEGTSRYGDTGLVNALHVHGGRPLRRRLVRRRRAPDARTGPHPLVPRREPRRLARRR
jgi:hypothetical protein